MNRDKSRYLLLAFGICLLPSIALGGLTTVQRKSQFEKALASIMAAAMPSVGRAVVEKVINDYLNAKPNKAQAIESTGEHFWRSTQHEDEAVASQRALEGCQLRYGKPCALVAVNDEIAVDGDLKPQDMPRLHYTGHYDVSQIPIIRLGLQRRPDGHGAQSHGYSPVG